MAIADKLTYLNTTKLLLRDAIRRAGHYLPDSATFRSYPYVLLPDEASLGLDFVRGEYVAHNWRDGTVSRAGLSNIMTTTRASGGGYFDHMGVFQWAANNEPRIDHDPATLSTSTSSVTLASGSVTLAVTVTYPVGAYVRATADASNWMAGRVTASTGTSVTIWVDRVVGSGTFASWTVIRVRGLLVEEGRTNLLTYSSDFSNSAFWNRSNSTITANAAVAPDGTMTADKLVMTAGVDPNSPNNNGIQNFNRVDSGTSVSSLSFFAKAGEVSSLRVRENISTGAFLTVDLITGAITNGNSTQFGSPSAVNCGNGWRRISFTTAAGSTSGSRFGLRANAVGDGTSGIYIWGAQLEVGSFPTSYIPTTAAQVTRAADQCVVSNLADWYRADEGALLAVGSRSATASVTQYFATLSDGSGNGDSIRLFFVGGSNQVQMQMLNNGVSSADLYRPESPGVNRAVTAWSAANSRLVVNGSGAATDTSVVVPDAISMLRIGVNADGTLRHLNGHIEQVGFIPRAPTDTELQRLTS